MREDSDMRRSAFPTIRLPLETRTCLERIFLALFLCLLTTLPLEAAPFPRGPGMYFDPAKLAALCVGFLAWVKLCAWVDMDARRYRFVPAPFNGMVLGAGLLGVFLIWLLPSFWLAWVFAWGPILGTVYWYLTKRNRRADVEDQLFNRAHYQHFMGQYKSKRKKEPAEKKAVIPVRFFSRNPTGETIDEECDERVQQSKGYKAALELVWEALQKRVTDIHLEPTPNEMAVRFRIDGMMGNVVPFTRVMGDAVINVFKVLGNLDITERRKPQDGSFSAEAAARIVEFRIATAGSVVGEKMVMRVLDSAAQLADLSQIGMTDSMQTEVRDVVSKPHGLFIVCGPTGSGKTTTLYACLNEIDRFQKNVITVENPVEYRLDGITQIEVNPKAGKTFASELRSILRQDPDVILVGEIRDKETAEIACQAAQTGHVVFSTLHANDAVTAIIRLIDLGVPAFMLSTALQAVLSQRLVRKLCKHCKRREKPAPETLQKLQIDPDAVRYLYRAHDPADDESTNGDDKSAQKTTPCEHCRGVGYLKRTGIFDLLVFNDRIRDLIRENPNVQEIRRVAAETGLKTLFDDGARLVIDGETSIQELLRVSK